MAPIVPIKGYIYIADLPKDGNQQSGKRPVIVTQNEKGNLNGPRVHVVPLSSRTEKASHMPTHVHILKDGRNGLRCDSIALAENLQSVQKERLLKCIGRTDDVCYAKVARAIRLHLAI